MNKSFVAGFHYAVRVLELAPIHDIIPIGESYLAHCRQTVQRSRPYRDMALVIPRHRRRIEKNSSAPREYAAVARTPIRLITRETRDKSRLVAQILWPARIQLKKGL